MNPEDSLLPRVPLGTWVDASFDWLKENGSWLFDTCSAIMRFLVGNLTDLLMMMPALALIRILALIALTRRSWKLAVGTVIGFALVLSMDQWETMVQTMALVLVATVFAVAIAVDRKSVV